MMNSGISVSISGFRGRGGYKWFTVLNGHELQGYFLYSDTRINSIFVEIEAWKNWVNE